MNFTTKSFRQSINEDRFVYYGIAILLVVLYHIYCRTKLGIVLPFAKGAIGVDIFMFFSGYGLCFSYEKNSLKEFYWRRFQRIYPIFWVNFLFLALGHYVSEGGGKFTLMEFVCNFLSIPSFYGIGGTMVDWFTAAILQFYLFFPVLYFLVKKAVIPVYICSVLFALAMLYRGDLTWQQYCFVDRIPIFLLGIAFHLYQDRKTLLLGLMAISVLLGFALLVCHFCHYVVYMCWLTYGSLCPLLLYVLYLVVANRRLSAISVARRVRERIRIFGKSSLEIYYGDQNAAIAAKFCQGRWEMFFYDVFLRILFSYVFYCVSKELREKLKRRMGCRLCPAGE